MIQTPCYRADLAYDLNETFEQLGARRQHALDHGRQAVRERQISGDLYLFYEYVVERVGANKYTWIGEDTLAEVFGVDASTIKRWIAKLVRAGLIRRQRQFATSSRTYITAYDPTTIVLDGEAEDTTEVDAPDPAIAVVPVEDAALLAQEDQGTTPTTVSFRRTDAPTFGADLRRDLKDSHLRLGGGGKKDLSQNPGCAPDVRRLLDREGVSTFYLAPQIQQTPLDELRAVSGYLDQQHNIRDRARLFAALAIQGFGGLLLAGRAPHGGHSWQDRGRSPKANQPHHTDPLRYVSGELAPYIQGIPAQAVGAPRAPDPDPACTEDPAASTHLHLWQHVLNVLRPALTTSEFDTWFGDARLLHLADDLAVIGTPNIFAREKLTMCYQAQIAQALAALTGRPVQVQIELGG